MNSFTLNVDDYISEQEKAQIVKDEFRKAAALRSAEDYERIISNAAYTVVREQVDNIFDVNMVELLKVKTHKVVSELSTFTVFNKPDTWDRSSSKGYKELEAAIENAKESIQAKVAGLIDNMDEDVLLYQLKEPIAAAILSKLTVN